MYRNDSGLDDSFNKEYNIKLKRAANSTESKSSYKYKYESVQDRYNSSRNYVSQNYINTFGTITQNKSI